MKRKELFSILFSVAVLSSCGGRISTDNVVPEISNPTAYLFSYFENDDAQPSEALRFAVSEDAVNWHALNGNRPILESSEISNTGGIRDPHILRGAKGGYYMVATDMYTRRDGWGFNPGIVMLYSEDLVNWSSSALDFTKIYPEDFGDVQYVWAPQTVYDPSVDKYLVYFTIRYKAGAGNDRPRGMNFFCAYANADFTGFEEVPHLMWSPANGAIDGDIIQGEDGVLHFFNKGSVRGVDGQPGRNGITQATASSLQGPWVETGEFYDAYANERTGVEGSGIFKLNPKDSRSGSTEYVLMYDIYTAGRYEFQRSNDLYEFTSEPESFTKDFFPRHGTVMPISARELKVLKEKWGE